MPGDEPDERIGRVLDGRYRIDARIAAGGMGVVFRGERLGIGKQVAIKFLHRSAAMNPDHVKRFEREAAAMSRVTHPHLVSIIDHGIADRSPFLIMEYHEGESVRDVLKRGPLPPVRAVAIARHIVAGMQGFHAAGVVHRDLKPDNVLLLAGLDHDFAKVLDFGIAKIFDQAGELDVTRVGQAIGSPPYMSPEQARCAKVDLRTDIYSIGVILFEMIVGERPFTADEDLALLRMHVEDPPPAPRTVGAGSAMSEALEKVILTALEKHPAARYQTAAELAKALLDTPEGRDARVSTPAIVSVAGPPTSEAPTKVTRTGTRPPIPRRRSMGIIVLMIVIGAALGWTLRDPRVIRWLRGVVGADGSPPDATPLDAPPIDAPIDAPSIDAISVHRDPADAAPPHDAGVIEPEVVTPADAVIDGALDALELSPDGTPATEPITSDAAD